MERKEGRGKTAYMGIFGAIMLLLLFTAPCYTADIVVPSEETGPLLVLSSEVSDFIYVTTGGTVELMPYGYTSDLLYIDTEGTLKIYGSHEWASTDEYVEVAQSANVTLFTNSTTSIILETASGLDATLDGTTIIVDHTNGWKGKLTWIYQGNTYSLNIWTWSDITVEVIGSEDPLQLIQDLIATVENLNAQNGIINSLDAKLDAALNALDDVNANNDAAAINTLQAFINAVEAQRGNKIPIEDADILIADAQAIIDLLST